MISLCEKLVYYTLERDNRELQLKEEDPLAGKDYTLERDNRELQQAFFFFAQKRYYTLERDNRELQPQSPIM